MSVLSLSTLAFMLIGGVLGDIFGRRRVLLIGLGILIAANLLAVVAPSTPWFVASRFIAGGGGTLVLPLSLSNLYIAFASDEARRAKVVAVYVLFATTAALFAGILGQTMQRLFDWRVTFLVPTGLAVAALLIARRAIAESAVPNRHRFDVIGHAAWAFTVLCLVFTAVAWVAAPPGQGWILTTSLSGVAVGIAVLIWWDYRTPDSIFGESNIQRRALIALVLFGLCLQFGFVAYAIQVRNALQAVYGYSAGASMLALVPLLIGMIWAAFVAVRRLALVKPQALLSAGLLICAAVCALTILTRASGFYPWLGLLLAIYGAALLAANSMWTAVFFTAVPPHAVGVRTGISSATMALGASLGGAVSGALLARLGADAYERLLLVAGVPEARLGEALVALNSLLDPATPDAALDPAIAERLIAGYQLAYLGAYERVLLLAAGVCLAGALLAWFGLGGVRAAVAAKESG